MPAKTKEPAYRPEMCIEVARLAPLGCRDPDIALLFGVTEETVREWRRAHPEFAEAITRAKLEAGLEVTRALYEAAFSGDVDAMTFWLGHRCPVTRGGTQPLSLSISLEVILERALALVEAEQERRSQPETLVN